MGIVIEVPVDAGSDGCEGVASDEWFAASAGQAEILRDGWTCGRWCLRYRNRTSLLWRHSAFIEHREDASACSLSSDAVEQTGYGSRLYHLGTEVARPTKGTEQKQNEYGSKPFHCANLANVTEGNKQRCRYSAKGFVVLLIICNFAENLINKLTA